MKVTGGFFSVREQGGSNCRNFWLTCQRKIFSFDSAENGEYIQKNVKKLLLGGKWNTGNGLL